jgi:hypothetical protein
MKESITVAPASVSAKTYDRYTSRRKEKKSQAHQRCHSIVALSFLKLIAGIRKRM